MMRNDMKNLEKLINALSRVDEHKQEIILAYAQGVAAGATIPSSTPTPPREGAA